MDCLSGRCFVVEARLAGGPGCFPAEKRDPDGVLWGF